jgi:hypothetical protein
MVFVHSFGALVFFLGCDGSLIVMLDTMKGLFSFQEHKKQDS